MQTAEAVVERESLQVFPLAAAFLHNCLQVGH
jgi:hypothetical protein